MPKGPERIYCEVTRGCNLRCVHCRASPTELASPDDLTTEQWCEIMDQIAEVCSPALVLTGGEPLFREDIFDLGRYGVTKRFRMGLATNGTLVTAEVARRIREAGFGRVSVSLDGPDADTHDKFRLVPGAFDAAVKGIEHLRKEGLYIQVNTTVTTHNCSQLEEIRRLVIGLKTDAWHLFLLVPVGCGIQIAETMQVQAKEYEQILNWIEARAQETPCTLRAICAPHFTRVKIQQELLRRRTGQEKLTTPVGKGCTAGTAMCFISHLGKVYPCGYLPLEAGDLLIEAFSDIWESSPLFQGLRDPNQLKGKCGVCEFRYLCSGCRARAYGMTGDYLEAEPFCLYEPHSVTGTRVEVGVTLSRFWTDEAKAQILRIPYPLRQQVVETVEAYAISHEIDPITPEVMREGRKGCE